MTIRWPSWESSTMKPGREDPVWSDSSLGKRGEELVRVWER